MEELNIKCNDLKEFKYIEKYFLDNDCTWKYEGDSNIKIIEYPCIIYNEQPYFHNIYRISYKYFDSEKFKTTEAKHIIRKEKLKRINKD